MIIAGVDVGILTAICALLFIAIVWSIVKLIRRIVKKRDWQYHAIVLVLLLVLFGVAGYFEGKQQYINYWASEITRAVVGRDDVSAKCVRALGDSLDVNQYGPYVGWVKPGDNYSKLDRTTCKRFQEWLATDRKTATNDQAYALHTIMHEAIHVAGEFNESETEYKSIILYEDIMVKFGMDREFARNYVEHFKKNITPRLPEQYHVDWAAKENAKQE
ncbi:hypothetical protein FWC31_03355 [Candidatus Saccharibacteria bacterium]|nr:hypothetical protein [Candidatus Saccharibacteria bacterium]